MSIVNINNLFRYLVGKNKEVVNPVPTDLMVIGRWHENDFLVRGIRVQDLGALITTKKTSYIITGGNPDGEDLVSQTLIHGDDDFEIYLTKDEIRKIRIEYVGSKSIVPDSGTVNFSPRDGGVNEVWDSESYPSFPRAIATNIQGASTILNIGGMRAVVGGPLEKVYPRTSAGDILDAQYVIEIHYLEE